MPMTSGLDMRLPRDECGRAAALNVHLDAVDDAGGIAPEELGDAGARPRRIAGDQVVELLARVGDTPCPRMPAQVDLADPVRGAHVSQVRERDLLVGLRPPSVA